MPAAGKTASPSKSREAGVGAVLLYTFRASDELHKQVPMSMKSLILAAALAGLPAAAHAQNAEEAVAYAFFGLADGANLVRGTTTMLWKEAAVSPATFELAAIVKGSPVPLRFTVKSVGECTFEVTVEGPPNVIPGKKRLFAKVDLRRITGVTVAEGARTSTISGSGFAKRGCRIPLAWRSRRPTCSVRLIRTATKRP